MAFGIPLELITMLGSSLMGGLMTIWGMRLKDRIQTNKLLLVRATAQGELSSQAREYADTGYQWTRRIIAVSAILAIIVLPKVVAVFRPELAVTVGWTEFHPGFLFFTEGRDVTIWQQATGLTITPLDTHLVSAIVGLYFGGSIVRNS